MKAHYSAQYLLDGLLCPKGIRGLLKLTGITEGTVAACLEEILNPEKDACPSCTVCGDSGRVWRPIFERWDACRFCGRGR